MSRVIAIESSPSTEPSTIRTDPTAPPQADGPSVTARTPSPVTSSSATNFPQWANSTHLEGDLVEMVRRKSGGRDVIVAGSISVVHALMAADLMDEYRLLIFPTILGTGQYLFPNRTAPADLRTVAAGPSGAALPARFERDD